MIILTEPNHPSHVLAGEEIVTIRLCRVRLCCIQLGEWRQWVTTHNNGTSKCVFKPSYLHISCYLSALTESTQEHTVGVIVKLSHLLLNQVFKGCRTLLD